MHRASDVDIDFVGGRAALLADTALQGRHFSDAYRTLTDAWLAQQLREATPFGTHPKYLIRDNDSKFGPQFAQVAAGTGIKILKTPYRAPKANSSRSKIGLKGVDRDFIACTKGAFNSAP